MALGPGSIAFVGFNADGNDNIAFVTLDTIPAGTVIFFQDNEWNGAAFNTGESSWSWTATSEVAPGVVVLINNIGSALATDLNTNTGTVAFVDASNRGLSSGDEIVYAFIGTDATTPAAFLTAAGSNSLTSGASLTGTGLVAGDNALSAGVASGVDIAAYTGSRSNQAAFAGYRSAINTLSNWVTQDAAGDQSIDTIAPDVPFSTAAFSVVPSETQTVNFAPGSVTVSRLEGNAFTIHYVFTVERTGGTTGVLSFSGSLTSASADGTDFIAGLPLPLPLPGGGQIAAGETSATITIDVAGDTTVEPNEPFTLTIDTVSNSDASVSATIGVQSIATGEILDDDASALGGITILPQAPSLEGAAATPVATNSLQLLRLGAFTPASGNAEVVSFDPTTARMFILNTSASKIDIVSIAASGALSLVSSIDLTERTDFGGGNSVAVKNGIVAVGFNGATAGDPGHVAFFDTNGAFVTQLTVGVMPDQLTFTPDGTRILSANEAEPASTANNPAGSVSIIDVSGGAAGAIVTNTISFASLNGSEAALRAGGLPILAGQTAAADIEPEYITISADGTRAYVTLQEVDAVAIIDLTNPTADRPMSILPLGGVDHSLPGNAMDVSDQDGGINIVTAPVTGLLQPDSIASFTVGADTYFITANEGDARVAFTDSVRLSSASYVLDPTAFPDAATLKANTSLGRLNVLTTAGDTDGDGDFDKIYTLGGRGFSIFRQNADGTISKVRESGGEFERIIAALPDAGTTFNQNQASGTFDTRSDDKAGEPEGVDTGVVGGRRYAFIGLERQGGIMVYDVTDPANAAFVSYMPPTSVDHGAEVIRFVSAADSPTGTALVLSANEVGGTTSVYAALPASAPQEVRFDAASVSVTLAEGNSATTQFNFIVERTNGVLGDVDFTAQLAGVSADGADLPGAALPRSINGTIAAGLASTVVTIDVAGDTAFEGAETFTVTLTDATNTLTGVTAAVASTQIVATGTISNDDAAVSIGDIQGTGHTSPGVGQIVTLTGVVSALDTNGSRGFYMQDGGDGNPLTSDGIFVFLPSGTLPTVGNQVQVTGTVAEFTSGTAPGTFSTTELSSVTNIVDQGAGPAIVPTVIGGAGGLVPPTSDLTAGGLFHESLEGMLVTIRNPVAVGPTNSFGEVFTVVDNDGDPSNGLNATGLTPRGNLLLTPGNPVFGDNDSTGGDYNPERIQIDDDSGVSAVVTPKVNVNATLNDVTGILRYDFGNYEVIATQPYTVNTPSTLVKETSTLTGTATRLLVAAYNAENLDPGDGAARFTTIGQEIVTRLLSPDIIALQEVQDNDGPTNSSTIAADVTLQMIIDAIAAAGGPAYSFLDNPFIGDDTNGGEPGGNIRTAYLYRADRVGFVNGSLKTIAANGTAVTSSYVDQQTNPDNPFFTSRPPLAATFTFNGNDVTVINNHFTSKSGSAPLLGSDQPPFAGGEIQRAAQGQAVNTFVDGVLAGNPGANIVVLGDFNEFPAEQPMDVLKGQATISNYDTPGTDPFQATATFTPGGTPVLNDLLELLPADQHYDYVFDGNSETLDHVFASNALLGGAQYDIVRINAEFNDQTSDHEPLVASFDLPQPYTLQILHFYGESGILAAQTAPILGAMVDKFRLSASNTLVLAEGDTWIPGPWLVAGADPSLNAVPGIGATALARPDIAIMNALGVNASALGNHEFDLGSPVVSGAIAASGAWVGAQFPFITGNLDFSADASLRSLADASIGGSAANAFAGQEASAIKGKIAPYTVVTLNGEKIGIVGATTFELLNKTSPNGTVPKDDGNGATDDLQEVAIYVQAAVDALTAAGVNKIVMVDQLDTITRNQALAPMVSGIDVMVAGGGHERLGDANDVPGAFNGHDATFAGTYPIVTAGLDGSPMLIVTTDVEYTYLGRLQVQFDANGILDTAALNDVIDGAYASNEATLQAVYGTSQTAAEIVAASTTGSKVQAISSAINSVVIAKDGTKFGFSNVYLEGDRVFGRAEETNLGDLTADANAFKALEALGGGVSAVVSLKNGGGLRASIGSIDEDGGKIANPIVPGAAGNVSQLDVENALRFDNKMMVCDLTPQGLLNILNYAAGLAPGNGGFPQLGGIRFSYDPDFPAGAKVVSVALYDLEGNFVAAVVQNGVVVAGAPASIPMVVLNFTANGGDGYPIKANADNFRFLLNDGTLSAPVDEALDFTAAANVPANALGEQKAFEDLMLARFNTEATAYNQADTPAALDLRIENLNAVATDAVIPCFAAGTRIATERGEIAVEELREGDMVTVLLGSGAKPIVWLGYRRVDCRRHPQPRKVWPVRIAANAFGANLPVRDLYLSPDHGVFMEGVLIPVRHLINDASIVQTPVDEIAYFHVELSEHDVILAEGLPAESYLDTDDRRNFANGGGPVRLFPDFSATNASLLRWEAFGCAPPRVVGQEVDTVKLLLRKQLEQTARRRRPVGVRKTDIRRETATTRK